MIFQDIQSMDENRSWHSTFQNLHITAKANAGPQKTGKSAVNRIYNRYRDVVPYDHSLVRLRNSDTEYINANLVKVSSINKEYILTQGPLPNTCRHFWEMVWEQNTYSIVMLNRVIEKNQKKCHQYWPLSGSVTMGDITVTLKKEENFNEYFVRILEMEHLKEKETRSIRHFHYVAWPDFGVPESPQAFLKYLLNVQEYQDNIEDVGPPVIHCSAGIGRSGTFALIDAALTEIKRNNDMMDYDVKKVLLEMRTYRAGLIQTTEQLRFSYIAILEGTNMVAPAAYGAAYWKMANDDDDYHDESEEEVVERVDKRNAEDDHDEGEQPKAKEPRKEERPPPPGFSESETDEEDIIESDSETEVPVVSDTTEVPVVSDATEVPVVSDTTEVPVVSDTTEVPVVSDTTEVPVVSGTTEVPVVSDTTEVPVVSDTTEVPVVSDTTEVPVVSDTTEVPVVRVSDTTEVPVVSDTTEVPVVRVSDTTEVPVVSDTTEVPVVSDTTEVPVVSGKQEEDDQARMGLEEGANAVSDVSIGKSKDFPEVDITVTLTTPSSQSVPERKDEDATTDRKEETSEDNYQPEKTREESNESFVEDKEKSIDHVLTDCETKTITSTTKEASTNADENASDSRHKQFEMEDVVVDHVVASKSNSVVQEVQNRNESDANVQSVSSGRFPSAFSIASSEEVFSSDSAEKVVNRWCLREEDGQETAGGGDGVCQPAPKRSAMRTNSAEGKRKSVSFVQENGEAEQGVEGQATEETEERETESSILRRRQIEQRKENLSNKVDSIRKKMKEQNDDCDSFFGKTVIGLVISVVVVGVAYFYYRYQS